MILTLTKDIFSGRFMLFSQKVFFTYFLRMLSIYESGRRIVPLISPLVQAFWVLKEIAL